MNENAKNKVRAKNLIVISYDAFSEDNWELAKSLPNLSKLINNGAYSTGLSSVYPTLTYVVHSTIVTGVYSDKHGVFHNNPLQPFKKENQLEWHWYRKDIKTPTIYDLLNENKMTTAGILWPVTGRANIKYNMPEMAAINKENQALKILRNGSPLFCIGLQLKYGKIRDGIEQPNLDDFTTMCAVDTIKTKKPNLLLLHLIEVDDAKHKYGIGSREVEEAIHRVDRRIGQIIAAAESTGIMDETVILILGDHGQFDVKYKIHLNRLFKDYGLIYEENGTLNWRAYVQAAGGSAILHVRENDEEAEILALSLLSNVENDIGIEKIYKREELDKLNVHSSIKYMIEANHGYSFDDSLDKPLLVNLEKTNIRIATHGYSPNKNNYRSNLIISGSIIKNDFNIGAVEMVDIAPTMAEILGLEFYQCDGRVLSEIFL